MPAICKRRVALIDDRNWAGGDRFFAWLFEEDITGIFFLAGDWHSGVLHRLNRPGFDYPLYELMSSNLAVRRRNPEPPSGGEANWGGGPQSAAPDLRHTLAPVDSSLAEFG